MSITDVEPAIFRHLLYYVYGGSVSNGEMKTHAKDIINAADKYSINPYATVKTVSTEG